MGIEVRHDVDPAIGKALSFLLAQPNRSHSLRCNRRITKTYSRNGLRSYARGKLSPIASTATDFASQSDFAGRPLSFSSDKPPKGVDPYTWPEYLLTQQSPIPVAMAVRDTYETLANRGMTTSKINALLEGLATGVIGGGTGVHIGQVPPEHESKGSTGLPKLKGMPKLARL